MGFFTWTLANRKIEKNRLGNDYKAKCKLPYYGYGCVICPDDTFIEEENYEGYGIFNGQDVYNLVVDWNRGHLLETLQANADSKDSSAPIYHTLAKHIDENDEKGAVDFINALVNKGLAPPYLKKDWKRCLGIEISHRPIKPPFPIKITDTPHPRKKYADLPPSIQCQ